MSVSVIATYGQGQRVAKVADRSVGASLQSESQSGGHQIEVHASATRAIRHDPRKLFPTAQTPCPSRPSPHTQVPSNKAERTRSRRAAGARRVSLSLCIRVPPAGKRGLARRAGRDCLLTRYGPENRMLPLGQGARCRERAVGKRTNTGAKDDGREIGLSRPYGRAKLGGADGHGMRKCCK